MRLIDADAFHEQLEEIQQEMLDESTYSSNFAAAVIETVQDEYLRNMPTVDAVEVVRCKDCKFYDSAALQCDHEFWMDAGGWSANAEQGGFCHKGERREGD